MKNNTKVAYEKPSLKFVSLRNEESVANTCWGHHSSGKVLFCDTPGTGYVSFQIKNGSCTLDLINVTYYVNKSDSGTPVASGSDKYNELDNILRKTGGESGNPYKGEGTTVIPGDPLPSWS